MDCHLLKGWVVLMTEKIKTHTGRGALAASEEWPLSTDFMGLARQQVNHCAIQHTHCLPVMVKVGCLP